MNSMLISFNLSIAALFQNLQNSRTLWKRNEHEEELLRHSCSKQSIGSTQLMNKADGRGGNCGASETTH